MKTFAQVVSEVIEEQGHVHLPFEQGMYFLAEDLERILQVFREAGVPFEVIGGECSFNGSLSTKPLLPDTPY